MLLDYAKTKSDATVQREGNEEEFEMHKRRRLAEKGGRSLLSLILYMTSGGGAANVGHQRGNKHIKLPKSRRSSSGLQSPLLLTQLRQDQQKQHAALVSNLRILGQAQLYRKNTCRRIRFSSCKIYQTITMWMGSLQYLADSKASGRCDWYLGGKGLRSSSTKQKRGPSVLRKARLVWALGRKVSP